MTAWNPASYMRFASERQRPSVDLLARVPAGPRPRIVDLGCGNGISTRTLVERYPESRITGVDTSLEMLAAARLDLPGVYFEAGDAAQWRGGPVDLIFANAVMHWVPDHVQVLARLVGELAPGGCLAVQTPDNEAEPSHAAMRAIAAEAPFREKLAGVGAIRDPIGTFADYEGALAPLCEDVDIWRTTYVHRLESPAAIVAWVEGAGLRPFLAPLAPAEREDYLARYHEAIAKAYPRTASGGVLLAFPRLFVVARRRSDERQRG